MSFFVADFDNKPASRIDSVDVLHVDFQSDVVWLWIPGLTEDALDAKLFIYNSNPPHGKRPARLCPVNPAWTHGALAIVRLEAAAIQLHFAEICGQDTPDDLLPIPLAGHDSMRAVIDAVAEAPACDLAILRRIALYLATIPIPVELGSLAEWLSSRPPPNTLPAEESVAGSEDSPVQESELVETAVRRASKIFAEHRDSASPSAFLLVVFGSALEDVLRVQVLEQLRLRYSAVYSVHSRSGNESYSEQLADAMDSATAILYVAGEWEKDGYGWLGYTSSLADERGCTLHVLRVQASGVQGVTPHARE